MHGYDRKVCPSTVLTTFVHSDLRIIMLTLSWSLVILLSKCVSLLNTIPRNTAHVVEKEGDILCICMITLYAAVLVPTVTYTVRHLYENYLMTDLWVDIDHGIPQGVQRYTTDGDGKFTVSTQCGVGFSEY